MFSFLQSWKLIGKRKIYAEKVGGFFFPDYHQDIEATVIFYEKASGKRKIDIIGVEGWEKKSMKTLVQPLVYDWLYARGQLPVGVELFDNK